MSYKSDLHRQIDNVCRWADCSPNSLDVAVHNAKTFLTQFKQPESMAYDYVGIRIVDGDINDKATMLAGLAMGEALYQTIEVGMDHAYIESVMSDYIKRHSSTMLDVRKSALNKLPAMHIQVVAILKAREEEKKEKATT